MGCRLVACITIVVIICLELLTNILAFPAKYGNKTNDQDVQIPIHKRSLQTGERYTFDSSDTDQLKTIYAFSAEPGDRLNIEFKSIEIARPEGDVVNVYSGTPQPSMSEKSKTTDVQSVITQAQFKEQTKRMPLLISSKSVNDMLQKVLILTDKSYQADANELTVLFDKSYTGQFIAMVESKPGRVKNYDDNGGSLLRNSRDPGIENAVKTEIGKSFSVCKSFENGNSGDTKPVTYYSNSGTITSHPEFSSLSSDSDNNLGLENYADSVCKSEITADGDITVHVGDIKLADYDLACHGDNLLIEDLTDNKIKEVKLCDDDDIGSYKFSNKIRLTLSLGTFLSDASGFLIRYDAKVLETEEVVSDELVEDPEKKKERDGKVEGSKTTGEKDLRNLTIVPKTDGISESSYISDPPKSTTSSTGGGPYPGLFIISVIVVAILLIIILSAAGAIACYRNHQQEQIINSMHERLSDIHGTGYSPVDGSHTSLRNVKMRMPDNVNLGVSGNIVCQKVTEEDHRLLSSPESSESQK